MEFAKHWKIIVDNINRELREKGWSIQELADHADKDRASMSKIVSGPQKDMKVSTLFRIAQTLEVDVCDLISKK